MARSGAVTFKGKPLTLAGDEVKVGAQAPDFTVYYFEAGELKPIRLADLKGKPTLLSVVPSLDTGVCQKQTKRFNEELARWASASTPSRSASISPSLRTASAAPKTSRTCASAATIRTANSATNGAR